MGYVIACINGNACDNANDGFLNLLWEVVPDVENLIVVF